MSTRLKVSETPRKFLALVMAYATILGTTPAFAHSSFERTATPIKHLVIIFQENISFDHYFGTYPVALNPKGEPEFHARPGTPTVNGLMENLLTNNPNLSAGNGASATNPFRLDRSQAATADQNHNYGPEQAAAHFGLMDLYPVSVGTAGPPPNAPPQIVTTTGLTMGYFDGNTVTALWNYAQYFAMSDNSYDTTFGPSTPGLLNLVSGQTNGVQQVINGTGSETDGGNGTLSVIGDPDPLNDVCSAPTRNQVQMGSKNIGDLLTDAGVTWGSFMGGFDLTATNSNGTTGCLRSSTSAYTGTTADYIPHHAFFQYWTSTANPNHTRPKSISEIGRDGQANHEYDINDFYAAVKHGNFPAVSFLKAPAYQDGHAGYSDPLDEQTFVVNTINFLEKTSDWDSTAVVILYDDSDGWYDHQLGPVVNQSTSPADLLSGPGACGDGSSALPGIDSSNPHAQGRCGYGPRQPLLVISPWAKENFVDNTVTDQTSVLRFVEDNWLGGERIGQGSFDSLANPITQMFDFGHRRRDDGILFLDPTSGELVRNFGHGW
jgi:phospholipase C